MTFGADTGRQPSGAWRRRSVAVGVVVVVGVLALFMFGRSPGSDTSTAGGPGPSATSSGGDAVTSTSVIDLGPRPDPTVCETSDCDQARLAVAELVELWWYGEPSTLADLADAAAGVTTAGFQSTLTERGDLAINKLDPALHVITGTEAVAIDDDLIVVLLEHRDVGADTGAPAVSHFDVVATNGAWLVDQVVTR